jgi:hypothetical protein
VKLGIIYFASERILDGPQIRLEAIGGQLHSPTKSLHEGSDESDFAPLEPAKASECNSGGIRLGLW